MSLPSPSLLCECDHDAELLTPSVPWTRETIERRVVAPLMRAVGHSAARARRLQSGSLRGYLVWLVALVVGALAMLRLGAL